MYIYIKTGRSTKRFVFLEFIYLFCSYIHVCFQLVAFVRKHIRYKALLIGYSLGLELTRVCSLDDFQLAFRNICSLTKAISWKILVCYISSKKIQITSGTNLFKNIVIPSLDLQQIYIYIYIYTYMYIYNKHGALPVNLSFLFWSMYAFKNYLKNCVTSKTKKKNFFRWWPWVGTYLEKSRN